MNFICLKRCHFDDHLNKELDLVFLEDGREVPSSLTAAEGMPQPPAEIVDAVALASNQVHRGDYRPTPAEAKQFTPQEQQRDWYNPPGELWVLYRDASRLFVLEQKGQGFVYREVSRDEAVTRHETAARQIRSRIGFGIRPAAGMYQPPIPAASALQD